MLIKEIQTQLEILYGVKLTYATQCENYAFYAFISNEVVVVTEKSGQLIWDCVGCHNINIVEVGNLVIFKNTLFVYAIFNKELIKPILSKEKWYDTIDINRLIKNTI